MLPEGYKKRSFLKFDCQLDHPRLVSEFESLKHELWESSYWGNVHCSIGMLLLRGGESGTEHDFFATDVSDKPLLSEVPYINHLISEDGPFGEAKYAFIFKLRPDGVTLKHQDSIRTWFDMYRVHIPIVTNSGAHLIVNNRSQHLEAGYAWSFDNQADHGVVNGGEERVHLIFDVPFSDKLAHQVDQADCLPGESVSEHIEKISATHLAVPSYPGDKTIRNGIQMMQSQGASSSQIAGFMNSKGIPSKTYPVVPWSEKMVDEFD